MLFEAAYPQHTQHILFEKIFIGVYAYVLATLGVWSVIASADATHVYYIHNCSVTQCMSCMLAIESQQSWNIFIVYKWYHNITIQSISF